MKKTFTYIFLLIMVCGLLGACGKDKQVSKKAETELIFSFESYKDITGTKLRVGEQIGKTAINKEEKYVTDGKASWMIQPQGDYGKENGYPYFEMQCLGTTFKSSDFNDYDKVMMDIYNESDEEVQIKWKFSVINSLDAKVETEEVIRTLKPNAWNTCEYDLTDEAYELNLRLDQVSSMTVTFLTKKENKTDTVPTIYLDNLRGHFSETERELKELGVDIENGIGFEDELEQYVFTTINSDSNRMTLSRVAYSDASVKAFDESMGEYALVGDAGSTLWPAFHLNYGKTLDEGTVIKFMIYVEADVDAVEGKLYRFGSMTEQGGKLNSVLTGNGYFNNWMPVYIKLEAESNKTYVHINFDDDYGNHILGTVPTKIYMDNFEICDNVDELYENEMVVKDDGVIFNNAFGRRMLQYTFEKPVKAGQVFTFDIDVKPAQRVAVWVLGDDMWGDEYFAQDFYTWDGKTGLSISPGTDTKNMTIMVEYRDTKVSNVGSTVEITNVRIKELAEVSADGTVKLTCPSRTGILRYNFKKAAKAGQVIAFDIDVTPAQAMNVWVLGDGTWEKEYFGRAYYTWEGKTRVIVNVPGDISNFTVEVAFQEAGRDYAGSVVTISNVEILDRATVGADGTVTLTSMDNTNYIVYSFDKAVKAGQLITFDLDVNPAQTLNIWILGDGTWEKEYLAKAFYTWEGKTTILAKMPADIESFTVQISYTEEGRDCTGNVATISNLQIREQYEMGEDGTLTMTCPANTGILNYNFKQAAKAGQIIAFDIEVTPSQATNVWVLGNGKWDDFEFFGAAYGKWEGKKRLYAYVKQDVKNFSVEVAFQEAGRDYAGNVVTISNIEVKDMYEVGENNSLTMTCPANTGILRYNFNVPAKAGQVLMFDLDVTPAQAMNVWVLGDGTWEKEYFGRAYYTWEGKTKVILNVPADISNFTVEIAFQEAGRDYMGNVVTITNLEVRDNWEVGDDDAVILTSYTNTSYISYTFDKAVKAGEKISFDIDFAPAQPVSIWVLGDGTWAKEYFSAAYDSWTGKTKIELTAPGALQNFMVYINYNEAGRDYSGNQAVISNVEITDAKEPEKIIAIDGTYPGSCDYQISGRAGQILSFDVEAPAGAGYNFWLLLDGQWGPGKEFNYDWQHPHVELELGADITFIRFQTGGSGVPLVFKNIKVTNTGEPERIIAIDGEYPGSCDYQLSATAGQTLSFDVEAPAGAGYNFWLLLDGQWAPGKEFNYDWQHPHVELVLGTNVTFVRFQTGGSGVPLVFKNIQIK